jgi:hypothetical protein
MQSNNANPTPLRSDRWQLCSAPGGMPHVEWFAEFSGLGKEAGMGLTLHSAAAKLATEYRGSGLSPSLTGS